MGGYYLGIDQGTTLTTALIMDEDWKIIARGSREHRQIYPRPGWVEHDPVEIYECFVGAIRTAIAEAGIRASDILCMGLDHQGETCLIWDKKTGEPLYNAIVWQDRRTADFAQELKEKHGDYIHRITGVLPDSYYTGTKIRWILDHVEGARQRAARGELLAGTLNTWLIWNLTGGETFLTDAGSAGRWMMMDLATTEWDRKIMDLLEIPENIIAPITDCNRSFGRTKPELFDGARIPIAGCLTDSQAGLIGGGGCSAGTLKNSYGTGSFMGLVTGDKYILSEQGLMTVCAFRTGGRPTYVLSGAVYIAGAAIQWLRDGLGFIQSPGDTEAMAASVADSGGVYFVPAFAGLATPYWDQYARGGFLGLTGGVTKEHMVRAVLESVAYQTTDCYRAVRAEYDGRIPAMRADGGMVDNGLLMQLQADMLGIPVVVPAEKETAAFGSACMAAYTIGALSSLEDVKTFTKMKKEYEPRMSVDERETRMNMYHRAVDRCREWIACQE